MIVRSTVHVSGGNQFCAIILIMSKLVYDILVVNIFCP